ncbi:MAG: ATP-binding protein [Nitrospiraceae bacterium]
MQALNTPQLNSTPLGESQESAPAEAPHRYYLILLHTLVTVALGYQLLFSRTSLLPFEGQELIALGLICTLPLLLALPIWAWSGGWIAGLLVIADTAATTIIIYLSGNANSDLYLTYYLILLIAAFAPSLRQMFTLTFILCGAYGAVLFLAGDGNGSVTEGHLLGIPVLLTLAIFYAHAAETVRKLRQDKVELIDHITERKQLEEQLRHLQKMEAVGRLAGGIAHDFNNVLTVIMGYSDRLLRRLKRDDPQRGSIEEIQLAGERATALTQQLLAFSRRQVLEPKVLDLNDIVASTEKMLQRMIGEDIHLVTVLRSDLRRVEVDPSKLEQVIMNLAVNARDAMPHGGKLIIETAAVDLHQAFTKDRVTVNPGQYVMLAVSDTGHGMDEATQSRIFEPFFTTKEAGRGTGLGLSTVYGIIKQSGGYVFVYSEPGRGATFKIYLPTVDKQVNSSTGGSITPELCHGTETILLVEDEPKVRALVRDSLSQYGYTVLEALHGIDALVIGARHMGPIHLLLTDVVMPQMSGREVADQLLSLRPDLKVLYMSGYTEHAIVHHGVLEPGITLIQKPFTSEELLRKVREVLDTEKRKPTASSSLPAEVS